MSFSTGEVVAGIANAVVCRRGAAGLAGELTLGALLAFLFLVTLFVGPVQVGTKVLNQAQNAVAGWRRVLGVLDTPADVADPGATGIALPRADRSSFDQVSVRLSRWADRAASGQCADPAEIEDRRRGRDRLGKDDFREAADPADGPGRGHGAHRRSRPTPHPLRLTSGPGRHGAAGRVSVRRHPGREHPLRPAGSLRRWGSAGLDRARSRSTGSTACRWD